MSAVNAKRRRLGQNPTPGQSSDGLPSSSAFRARLCPPSKAQPQPNTSLANEKDAVYERFCASLAAGEIRDKGEGHSANQVRHTSDAVEELRGMINPLATLCVCI